MENTIWRHDIPLKKDVPYRFSVLIESEREYFKLMEELEDQGYYWGRDPERTRPSSEILRDICLPEFINVYECGSITYTEPDELNLKQLDEVHLYTRQIG